MSFIPRENYLYIVDETSEYLKPICPKSIDV